MDLFACSRRPTAQSWPLPEKGRPSFPVPANRLGPPSVAKSNWAFAGPKASGISRGIARALGERLACLLSKPVASTPNVLPSCRSDHSPRRTLEGLGSSPLELWQRGRNLWQSPPALAPDARIIALANVDAAYGRPIIPCLVVDSE